MVASAVAACPTYRFLLLPTVCLLWRGTVSRGVWRGVAGAIVKQTAAALLLRISPAAASSALRKTAACHYRLFHSLYLCCSLSAACTAPIGGEDYCRLWNIWKDGRNS